MFDRVNAFVREARRIGCESELEEALGQICRELGFDYFALTHHVDIRRAPQPAIRLHNYPASWVDYFDDHRLGPSDPVHRASHLTSVGFSWTELPRLIEVTPRDQEIFRLANSSGIGDGYTVPVHVPGESHGSCSFATRPDRPLVEEHLPVAQLVGAFAFEAARRLSRMRSPPGAAPRPLTDRQRDCVLWAGRGKGDWEISRILGISRETVIQHMKDARERYEVSNRTMLTVQALFDGTISFFDVMKH